MIVRSDIHINPDIGKVRRRQGGGQPTHFPNFRQRGGQVTRVAPCRKFAGPPPPQRGEDPPFNFAGERSEPAKFRVFRLKTEFKTDLN